MRTQIKKKTAIKRRKTQATKSWLFLYVIGWKSGASFPDQSQSRIKQNQYISGLLSKINWKFLYELRNMTYIKASWIYKYKKLSNHVTKQMTCYKHRLNWSTRSSRSLIQNTS